VGVCIRWSTATRLIDTTDTARILESLIQNFWFPSLCFISRRRKCLCIRLWNNELDRILRKNLSHTATYKVR